MSLMTKMQRWRGVGRVDGESGSGEVGGLVEVEKKRRQWVSTRGMEAEGFDNQEKESIGPY